MSKRVFTPTNQKLLTNVAVVRHKKGGKRFEIACFKNKVVSWRDKVEKDIDEVLQTHTIFTNVTKGTVAKRADLVRAYGTEEEEEIARTILAKGELQVSQGERTAKLADTFREIATVVSDKCVNPDSKRPYTTEQIMRAMKDLHFSVKPTQGPKQQALEVIRQLQETIPIERAQMSVRVVLPQKEARKAREAIGPMLGAIDSEEWVGDLEIECAIDPGNYRALTEVIGAETKGRGTLEILNVKNIEEGDLEL